MLLQSPQIHEIKEAYKLIRPYIHKTPILKSSILNEILACNVQVKCENFQKAGAFKYRGATHAILRLTDDEKLKGVATHSSGNHAGALAKAAQINDIQAHIVMPNDAPKTKIEAVQYYGGNITFCEPTLIARETTLEKVISQTNAIMIHPYDNYNVICGQGTACLELHEQINEPDYIIAPVGGGGLLSGTSITAKALWNKTKVIGAEPELANDAYLSFKSKQLMPSYDSNTMADGLKTSLSALTFSIIKTNVDEIITVKEESIVQAMKLVFKYLKIIIEPSSAVVIASILENKEKFKGKTIAVIATGGNYEAKIS